MAIRNQVTLIGRTGADPEMLTFENGNRKASVSLATNHYYTNDQGEKVEQTDWHNLVAYGKTAEILEKYAPKGKELAISGRLHYRTYDREGQKVSVTEIIVEEVALLGGNPAGKGAE